KRKNNELRNIELFTKVSPYAEGSCMAKFGNTHVMCTASVDTKLPPWLRNSGKGWITAEYGMLPRSTHSRMDREVSKGKASGRTHEIQRLIGRSLRSVVDLKKLSDIQIKIDCDVIQADGGTRTTAITGAWVALYEAINFLLKTGKINENPISDQVAAISCGIRENEEILDLDYEEDSDAETDGNFVLTEQNGIVEIQATAEKKPFNKQQFLNLLDLAEIGTKKIFKIQRTALGLE
ncbi:ribonuclease PH, partial [Alphaproteobacteria bacterium]|nr:ribonuclease PH [Alphaproteobacteria bacterium]